MEKLTKSKRSGIESTTKYSKLLKVMVTKSHLCRGWDSFPTQSCSTLKPAGYLTIQLNSDTIYLDIWSDITG